MVHKLLIVEDNQSIGKVIEKIAMSLGFQVTIAQSFAQVKTILAHNPKFFAATIDVNLPDAPNGEVIPYVLQSKIPSIVMTGRMDEATRKKILNLPVIDYITKENAQAYHYLLRVLNHQLTNKDISVLVVDSSLTSCNETVELLRRRNFTIHAVPDGTKALKLLKDNPEIKIVITAHNMPGMTGIELLQKIRKQHTNNELIVIATSSASKNIASAKFIKNGADDFLQKPYCPEEFYSRIMQHIEKLHNLEKIHSAANHDYLTNLLNYRYFITTVTEAQEMSLDDSSTSVLAIIDIDNFKTINEQHKNTMGDKVLISLAQSLEKQFNDQILARLGGNQFAAHIKAENIEAAKTQLQKFQQTVSQLEVKDNDNQTNFSVCIGATTMKGESSVDSFLKIANDAILKAKSGGKNKLVLTEAS